MNRDRCQTCKRVKKRSNESNRRYWLLLHVIADKCHPDSKTFSAETWHTWAKIRYLGAEEVKLPNRKTVLLPHSTADLSKDEFNDYMMKVEQWANEHDVYLDEEVAA